MSIELQMLLWSIILGLVHVALSATLGTMQRGLMWNAGARDGVPKPLTGVAGRLDRANRNFLETFPFFAAAVLAVLFAQKTDSHTALGVQLYFWARVAYLPVYAAGIPFLRTLIWVVSMAGLILVLMALF
ncbi:MAPEG family protein [Dokdonella sp.]|uniref:MAPEG family protein n=1 Tax=Dokdonella sp. TaxID=2291710 RepID=UPI003529B62E